MAYNKLRYLPGDYGPSPKDMNILLHFQGNDHYVVNEIESILRSLGYNGNLLCSNIELLPTDHQFRNPDKFNEWVQYSNKIATVIIYTAIFNYETYFSYYHELNSYKKVYEIAKISESFKEKLLIYTNSSALILTIKTMDECIQVFDPTNLYTLCKTAISKAGALFFKDVRRGSG